MKIFEIIIEQALHFKTLIKYICFVSSKVNIQFIKCEKKNTIKNLMIIKELTFEKDSLINVELNMDNFSKFTLTQNKLVLGIDLYSLLQFLKCVGITDSLTLSISDENINVLNININNSSLGKSQQFSLGLLELPKYEYLIPKVQYDALITMESKEFNILCNNISNFEEYVNILCSNDEICFNGKCFNVVYAIKKNKTEKKIKLNFYGENTVTKGTYLVKNLLLYSQVGDKLCDKVYIYMKKDNLMLKMKYKVLNWGNITIFFSPVETMIKNPIICSNDNKQLPQNDVNNDTTLFSKISNIFENLYNVIL